MNNYSITALMLQQKRETGKELKLISIFSSYIMGTAKNWGGG
jgi:hypothetical protein